MVVESGDVLEGTKGAPEWRGKRRVENALEGVDYIARRQFVPVVEGHAVTQVRDVGEWVGVIEAQGQRRADSQVVGMFQQRAVHQLRHPLCRLVVAQPRVEGVRAGANGDGDDARIARGVRL